MIRIHMEIKIPKEHDNPHWGSGKTEDSRRLYCGCGQQFYHDVGKRTPEDNYMRHILGILDYRLVQTEETL